MDTIETDPAAWLQHGRHIIAAVLLAVLWTVESMAPMFVGRERRFSHIATNFALAAINALIVVLPLIGLTVPQLLVYEAISLPVILFHHSNLRISNRADRCLRWLIVTPWMHYVHHSRWQPETDSNYTSFLSVWDRLFGSFRLRNEPAGISLGLDNYKEREWRRLPGMLVAPFKKSPTRVVATRITSVVGDEAHDHEG